MYKHLHVLILMTAGSFILNTSLQAQAKAVDSGYFKSFDHTKIYYEVRGNGFPVLLIHGFIVNSNSWRQAALYDSLVAAGNKVILVDLRGNGRSDKPHTDAAYHNDAEAKDLMLLLKHLHIKEYDAVGYSRGSIITARLLALDKNVHKAVIGGMGSDFTNPNWPRRIQFYHALAFDTVASLHAMVQNVQKAGLDQQALALLQKYQPSTSKEILSKIKTPVLVIHGDSDIDSGNADELASFFPNAATAVTPGDHNHAASTPEFAAAVMAFLKKGE
ncbi:alpha/beta fold hydrolase [Parafilimonas sp.]|uniref:alpha/beta fold hydrolase n=1 Tax=Parafilimonas sp. TaxID=1969739 RepID=UPI0039E35AD9